MFRNRNLREFDEDPFLDPFHSPRDHMHHMMRSFSEPFGGPFLPSIMDGRSRGREAAQQPGRPLALREQHRDMSRSLLPFGSLSSSDVMRNPFGMFDDMMASMRTTMEEMHRNFGQGQGQGNMPTNSAEADTHSYSSSSVMTYSKVGDDPPKVFQATTSTRRAPGGIKETRRTLKDSESGVESMAIGHHIQDRGHVVEKKFNKRTGEKEFNQDFQNMDESEAQSFDEEWQHNLSRFQSPDPRSQLEEPQRRGPQAALGGPQAAPGGAQAAPQQPPSRDQGGKSSKSSMKGKTKQ